MIVSIKDNKYQILISSVLGFLYFMKTRDESISVIIVIASSFLLRKINIDQIINKKLNKENYMNFKTKAERNHFCKSLFNAQAIAAGNSKAKKWAESKSYLKALMNTKKELTNWNKIYSKNKDKI